MSLMIPPHVAVGVDPDLEHEDISCPAKFGNQLIEERSETLLPLSVMGRWTHGTYLEGNPFLIQ